MIVLYRGEIRAGIPIVFDGNPLEINGYNVSDITNVYIGFKKRSDADSDDKYLAKYWKDGNDNLTNDITFDGVNATFSLKIGWEDYDNLEIGDYEIIIGVKVTSVPTYIELSLEEEHDTVRIVKDKIRG